MTQEEIRDNVIQVFAERQRRDEDTVDSYVPAQECSTFKPYYLND